MGLGTDRIILVALQQSQQTQLVGTLKGITKYVVGGFWRTAALLASHLYWADGNDSIWEANLDGSDAHTIVSGPYVPFAVAANSTHIYWTTSYADSNLGGAIWEANLDGSDAHTIVTGQNLLESIAVNSSHLYWTNFDGKIWEANLDGTQPQTIFSNLGFGVAGVAVDNSHLYWSIGIFSVYGGAIYEANLDGSNARLLNVIGDQSYPYALAVGTSHLYWGTCASAWCNVGEGGIWEAGLDGNDPHTLWGAQNNPRGLAVDSGHVYWTIYHDVYEINLDGSGTLDIVTGQAAPAGVAVSPTGEQVRVPTHLALTCPSSISVGVPGAFRGTLTGAPANSQVVLLYEDQSGAPISHDVRTGAAGEFTDSFVPGDSGSWQMVARYSGDGTHAPALAQCAFNAVEPAPNDFSISVTPSSDSVQPGGSASATVNTSVTAGAPQTVSFSASGPNPGSISFSPASVTAGNPAKLNVQTNASTAPGTYVVTITGTGASVTHSATYTLTVTQAQFASTLSLQCTPDGNRRFISCTGQLTSNGAGIGGAQIMLTYQPPSPGSSTVAAAPTASDGTFSDTLNAPAGSLLASGSWQVQAQYAGDGTHSAASQTQAVTVP